MTANTHRVYCFVPRCTRTKFKNPEKLFFNVPRGESMKKWIKAVRRDSMSLGTQAYCCEDHFTLEEDVEDWTRYKLMKEAGLPVFKLKLKSNVLPHIFTCQPDRRPCQEKPPRTAALKRAAFETLQDVEKQLESEKVSIILCDNELLEPAADTPSGVERTISASVVENDPLAEETLPSEPSIASTSSVEETSTFTEPSDVSLMVTAETQTLTPPSSPSTKDFSCQIRPRYRSKGIQIQTSVRDSSCQTSSIQENAFEAADLNFSKNASSIYTYTSCDIDPNDQSYHPDECTPADVSFVDSEITSFINNNHLKSIMGMIESSPKLFIGIEPQNMFVISGLEKFGRIDRTDIFICLWKIRKNESEECLASLFCKDKSTISRILSHCIPIISALLKTYIIWPERKIIQSNVPLPFRANFSKVESIIDCFEVQIEKLTNPTHQAMTWSSYKSCNTMKFLVSCTPGGLINFISDAYGGCHTDVQIVRDSGYLDKLAKNTYVMADRGFKQLEAELSERECFLIRPPSVASGVKMSKEEVRFTRQIASLRIHVERVIRRIREFEFLGPHACFNHNLLAYIDHAAIIACALCNLQSPIVH